MPAYSRRSAKCISRDSDSDKSQDEGVVFFGSPFEPTWKSCRASKTRHMGESPSRGTPKMVAILLVSPGFHQKGEPSKIRDNLQARICLDGSTCLPVVPAEGMFPPVREPRRGRIQRRLFVSPSFFGCFLKTPRWLKKAAMPRLDRILSFLLNQSRLKRDRTPRSAFGETRVVRFRGKETTVTGDASFLRVPISLLRRCKTVWGDGGVGGGGERETVWGGKGKGKDVGGGGSLF